MPPNHPFKTPGLTSHLVRMVGLYVAIPSFSSVLLKLVLLPVFYLDTTDR